MILNKGTDINITWQEFIANQRFDNLKKITKLSDYVMMQQGKLLGHIIRADESDPMRTPTINNRLETPGVSPPGIHVGKAPVPSTPPHILSRPSASPLIDCFIRIL